MGATCLNCNTPLIKKLKFCSYQCRWEWQKGKRFYDRQGKLHTKDTKQKMKLARAGKKPALGMKHSAQTKLQIRSSVIKAKGKGGRVKTYEGYIKINCNDSDHPYKDHKGYVLEHRLVMEKKLNRYLLPHEVVHHIDEDITNNASNNLLLLSTSEHSSLHWQKRKNYSSKK